MDQTRTSTDDAREDIALECATCGDTFLWTAGEQQFFATRGLTQPRRCKPCRAARAMRPTYSPF